MLLSTVNDSWAVVRLTHSECSRRDRGLDRVCPTWPVALLQLLPRVMQKATTGIVVQHQSVQVR